MTMEIFKDFTVEAAHFLPCEPEGHKCRRLHGHSFRIGVFVSGTVDSQAGWIMDFGDISKAFAPLHAILDHSFLNELMDWTIRRASAFASGYGIA